MAAPVMWDAAVDKVSGEHTRRVPVHMEVVRKGSAIDLLVTPDAAFLSDPKTQYPVTVDPSTATLAKAPVSHMGLRAADENAIHQWKRVSSGNDAATPPKLTVTYNFRSQSGNNRQAGPTFTKDVSGTWQVNTTIPTLRDTFADQDGEKINGTFEVADAATGKRVGNLLVSPYVSFGQAAAVTLPDGVLKDGGTYKFRTSPYDGTHYNLVWSDWATFTINTASRPAVLPDMPQLLESGATETLTPLLTGLVATPNQGRVRAEFVLRDDKGNALPGTTVPEAWADSGARATTRVPEGVLRAGTTYRWAMRSCDTVGCSGWSYEQEFTALAAPAPKPPETQSVTLSGASLEDLTARRLTAHRSPSRRSSAFASCTARHCCPTGRQARGRSCKTS